jgi:uncharacterized protein involved in exopolysaccharide biosynthesis
VRLLQRPELFRASARIKIPLPEGGWVEPHAFEFELERVQSAAVLGKALEALDATNRTAPAEMAAADAISRLRRQLEFRIVPNTTLMEIRAMCERPDDAARIANAVAKAYTQRLIEAGLELQRQTVNSLKEQAQRQEGEIKRARENLERLKNQLQLSETQLATHPEYSQGKRNLEDLEDFLKLLRRKLEVEKADRREIRDSAPVEIVERAVPPVRPNYPNRFVSAALAVSSLVAAVVVAGCGVLLLLRRSPESH